MKALTMYTRHKIVNTRRSLYHRGGNTKESTLYSIVNYTQMPANV